MQKIHIGTSGFSYSYWKNRFYPEGLPAAEWLSYYAILFDTLELNNTFYRFPRVENLRKAAAAVPPEFRFSVKGHKVITHSRRMKEVKGKIKEFMDIVIEGLGDKLACVLYQLPHSFQFSEERLNDVLTNVSHEARNVVEFRHASWWNEAVFEAFRQNNLTFCNVSFPGLPDENVRSSSVFYKRMHGVPKLFESFYDEQQLQSLASALPENTEGYVFFNNTMFEGGYSNGILLKEMVESQNSIFDL